MSALAGPPPTSAIADLYDIMRDPASGMRQRLNAAVAAARVERLAMPGEQVPECVMFLREIVGTEHQGSRFRVEYRRTAATALSYYERRCKKAELVYAVPDQGERRQKWRRILNGALRLWLIEHGQWPARKDLLFGPDDSFEVPAADPEVVASTIFLPLAPAGPRRRQRAIDERLPAGAWSGTAAERDELLQPVVRLVAGRLREFQ